MYRLVSAVNSKYVWDIAEGSTTSGANLQLYEHNDSNAQKFTFTYDSDGYYKITNVNSGKVLDCAGASSTNGANVRQYTSNNSAAQRFQIVETTKNTQPVNPAPSPNTNGISYAPCNGVNYANQGLSAARKAALDKAKRMVTIQRTAPEIFPHGLPNPADLTG